MYYGDIIDVNIPVILGVLGNPFFQILSNRNHKVSISTRHGWFNIL